MKKLLKHAASLLLAFFARAVVRRYRPKIVMVTGSVGKTSTKDAVSEVLRSQFFVRKSEKSFNSEFGVPFTILGVENPWHNPLSWLAILKQALALLLLPNHYPTMLVLEVGSGKPGDLAQILKIATPDMVIVTCLPEIPVHVEAYASPEAVREEEFSPAGALPPGAPLIIPVDDRYAHDLARRTPAHITTYGYAPEATVRIMDSDFYSTDSVVLGMEAGVAVPQEGQVGKLVVKGSVGSAQLLPAAAAIAAGRAFGISLAEALTALESYEPPPGRGRILRGTQHSAIIDDSYNASPAAVEQALATLKVFPHAKRRIAVLGDMLELGRHSVAEHERIAAIADNSADLIVAVGIRSRALTVSPRHAKALQFDNAQAAAEALPEIIQKGDAVLVKGSQSVRMERVVEALLADPADRRLLVRQEKAWKRKG